jgi:hypothetical protein
LVKSLAGGGQGVYYNLSGHQVEFLIPRAGFDPVTASASKLSEYGFPPRPASKTARARWASEMSGSRPAPAPPFLAETHMRADTVYIPNWSGYAISGNQGQFTSAEAYYNEPRFYPSVCAHTSDVTWAGIGAYYGRKGQNRFPLAQDGTAFGVPGEGDHQAWWELYPYNYAVPVSLSARPGDTMDADVHWLGTSKGAYSFYMHDARTKKSVAFREYLNAFSGISAEVINERPALGNPPKLTDLSNYRTMAISSSMGNGRKFDTYPSGSGTDNNGRHGAWMTNTSFTRVLAQPGGIQYGGRFTLTQDHCS